MGSTLRINALEEGRSRVGLEGRLSSNEISIKASINLVWCSVEGCHPYLG